MKLFKDSINVYHHIDDSGIDTVICANSFAIQKVSDTHITIMQIKDDKNPFLDNTIFDGHPTLIKDADNAPYNSFEDLLSKLPDFFVKASASGGGGTEGGGDVTKLYVDDELAKKANKATTLAGYGITDAVKSDDVRLTDDRNAKDVKAWAKADVKPSYKFDELTEKPTTVDGFKITDAVKTNDSRLTDSRVASDVQPWAKELTKPVYKYEELTEKPTTLAGYGITDAVKSDDVRLTDRNASDVYAWAKSPNKPTYEFNEIGDGSLVNIKINQTNVSVGASALQSNTMGNQNTANGAEALYANTTGKSNTANGADALYYNTTGSYNTANGVNALYYNTNGKDNTANGVSALQSNRTGSYNTANGMSALSSNTNYSNCSGLGYESQVTADNQVQLGNANTTTYCYGAIQNRSDIRDKADVRDTKLGLDFISKLRAVDFKWDLREDYRQPLKEDATEEERAKWLEDVKLSNINHDGTKKRNRYHHGLIAQEVQELIKDNKLDFGGFQDHSKNGGDDVLSIGYEELIAPMIKAIQELKAEIDLLK